MCLTRVAGSLLHHSTPSCTISISNSRGWTIFMWSPTVASSNARELSLIDPCLCYVVTWEMFKRQFWNLVRNHLIIFHAIFRGGRTCWCMSRGAFSALRLMWCELNFGRHIHLSSSSLFLSLSIFLSCDPAFVYQ